jgi:hypothetical protein
MRGPVIEQALFMRDIASVLFFFFFFSHYSFLVSSGVRTFHLIVYYLWDCEVVTLSSRMSSAFSKISSVTVVTGV